jgi:hypothetical protein
VFSELFAVSTMASMFSSGTDEVIRAVVKYAEEYGFRAYVISIQKYT